MTLLKNLIHLLFGLANAKNTNGSSNGTPTEPAPLAVKSADTGPSKATTKFKNNSERLKAEFDELVEKNLELAQLIGDLTRFTQEQYGKDVVITMIDRTDAEQDEIYKNDAKYKVKKFRSPHQGLWQAVDLRTSIYTAEEITEIELYLNTKYNPTNYFKWTARNHVVGSGAMHFHVQLAKKNA
jgi:hypothetical protein